MPHGKRDRRTTGILPTMHPVLEPFRIGDIEVGMRVVLAPLAGYTDMAFRRICRRLGAPYVATEMLLDTSVLARGKLRRRLMSVAEDEHPVAAQLIGNDPETMAAAAAVACEVGFDAIDLNFACPVRKALRRGRGGHLMREPDRAVEIVRAVVGAVDRPVTLKLRRRFGNDDTDHAFHRIAERAFDAGAAAVCAHARSVEQRYAGPADWGFLRGVRRRYPERTILGSGDVHAPPDALRMLDETGVDAVSAARGALGNPWFFRQVRALAAGREPSRPSLAEQRAVLAEHFDAACALYGPRRGPRMMRKFGIKYAKMHPSARRVRMAFVDVRRPEQWHEALDRLYPPGSSNPTTTEERDP